MNCSGRDADLLMLAHRELDRAHVLRVRAHLVFCPACRARLRRFEALTGALALNFRNPVLGVRAVGLRPNRAWASVGLLAALLSILGWLVASSAMAAMAPAPAPAPMPMPKSACPLHAAVVPATTLRGCPVHSVKKAKIHPTF